MLPSLWVRGKVTSFKLGDPSVGREEKSAALKEAKAYFKLASTYVNIL
jgi:aminoglycoside phosphotransferase family enzyme